MEGAPERLQKALAKRGIASRRRAADIIRSGRVRVDGRIVREPGARVDPGRRNISVDDVPLPAESERHRTVLVNKPRGLVCSVTNRDGRSVLSLLRDIEERLVPVGRLDKDSEGLLLLSNDGDLTLRLSHPRYQHEKEYRVWVSGRLNRQTVERLQSRMVIDGYRVQPATVSVIEREPENKHYVLGVILREGRNRQIRKMCDQVGLKVRRLVRIRIGALELGSLQPGKWRELTPGEIRMLSGSPTTERGNEEP